MWTYEWNHILALFYDSVVCFLLPKCVLFYQWCSSCFFITTVCFYDFCKTVLVKKYTPCQGMIWFSLSNVTSFTLAFMWQFNYTIEAPLSLRKTWKTARGRCPRTPAGAYAPRTLRARVLKKWPPSQPFICCVYFPKSVIKLHWLFHTSNRNTHFDKFFKN